MGSVDWSSSYFSPGKPTKVRWGNLPHWEQEDALYFITTRLADSIPTEHRERLRRNLEKWKQERKAHESRLAEAQFLRNYRAPLEKLLDKGNGSCCLGIPECRKLIEETIRFYDGEQIFVDRFTVAANHLHILMKILPGCQLADIMRTIKSYSAREINRITGRTGPLWQKEYYDHIVRNVRSHYRIRNYIQRHE